MPQAYVAEALAEALAPTVRGKRVLLARADRGRPVLEEALTAAGAEVERLTVYRNVDETQLDPEVLARVRRSEVDWITLTSSAVTRSLCERLDAAARAHLGRGIKLASISPVTSKTARELGLEVTVEACDYTAQGVVDAIVEHEAEGARK
jgi:uroporphyrinogen III methyltransferase/synthase